MKAEVIRTVVIMAAACFAILVGIVVTCAVSERKPRKGRDIDTGMLRQRAPRSAKDVRQQRRPKGRQLRPNTF